MLKNIRLHIEREEDKQKELEKKLAQHIAEVQNENINAFQRFIPSLVPYIYQSTSQNIAIFCNKFGKFNVVDYGVGRVLYGFKPEAEIKEQVNKFAAKSLFVDFSSTPDKVAISQDETNELADLTTYQKYISSKPLSDKNDLIIILGLGLGYHLKCLVEDFNFKHIIIYEPEIQYFSCSVMVTAWREILEKAKLKGTALYFQLGKDGRDIINDIGELREHFEIEGCYLYQHYHHPVFDSVYREFSDLDWKSLTEKGISFNFHTNSDDYCPIWTPPVAIEQYSSCDTSQTKFQNNLAALKSYFPDVHREFVDYKAKSWLPVNNENDLVNLINKRNLAAWYSENPKLDSIENFESYSRHPNKDGLVLGYRGKKLRNYLHYQFVAESESLLEELEEVEGALPDEVKSLIMFGIGAGYQLEQLCINHKVNKLFVCEPNRDFFYASLFSIDWAALLTKIDDEGGRLYINIGDDGTHLFRDLLNQFYAVGPYNLAHTFFYQGYYNDALNHAIAQLREQLQVVLSMGEYFDHAYFGINHTVEGINRGYHHLRKNPSEYLEFEQKEVPIFLVGNGPSLDYSIDTIKEWKENAIIVSCGTSLQVLHKNGITPDFHAEIEQNRSTYDWAARVDDADYLKNITLISCNGIHPDTCQLYKNILVAFKEGESSSVSTLNVLGEKKYEVLQFAFPTVSNFALNLFKVLGFQQLYLFGIDLGFIDELHHHSKSSGYYNSEGEPLYDFAGNNNTGIVVPGNFRKTVNTKQEFKISRMVMEDTLYGYKGDCFNTSDGAKIQGTLALPTEDILITSPPERKREVLIKLSSGIFVATADDEGATFEQTYYQQYPNETLKSQLHSLTKLVNSDVFDTEQAESLIEKQKEFLFASYSKRDSLLFYLLYGTTNYANALMSKLLCCEPSIRIDKFNQAKDMWGRHLSKLVDRINDDIRFFDVSAGFPYLREQVSMKRSNQTVLMVSERADVQQVFTDLAEYYRCLHRVEIIDSHLFSLRDKSQINRFDSIILDDSATELELVKTHEHDNIIRVKFVDSLDFQVYETGMQRVSFRTDFLTENSSATANIMHAVAVLLLNVGLNDKIVGWLPKYSVHSVEQMEKYVDPEQLQNLILYDFGKIIAVVDKPLNSDELVSLCGARALRLVKPYTYSNFVMAMLSEQDHTKTKERMVKRYPYLLGENNV